MSDCGDCLPFADECGITDDFNRVVARTDWPNLGGADHDTIGVYAGTATCGLDWSVFMRNATAVEVNGSELVITCKQAAATAFSSVQLTLNDLAPIGFGTAGIGRILFQPEAVRTVKFTLDTLGDPALDDAEQLILRFSTDDQQGPDARIYIYPGGGTTLYLDGNGDPAVSQITWAEDIDNGTEIPLAFFNIGGTYLWSIYYDGTQLVTSVTHDGMTYTNAQAPGIPLYRIGRVALQAQREVAVATTAIADWIVRFDDLIVPEVTLCTLDVFDDFVRTVADGWGTTRIGLPWDQSVEQFASFTVDPGLGFLAMPYANMSNVPSGGEQDVTGVPFAGAFTMTALLRVDTIDSTGQVLCFVADAALDNFASLYLLPSVAQLKVDDGTYSDTQPYADLFDGDWLWLKWEWIPGDLSRAKAWPYFDPEPDWLVSSLAIGFAVNQFSFFAVNTRDMVPDGASDTAVTVMLVDFDYPEKPTHETEPRSGQAVYNEVVGTGDGSSLVFATRWPYQVQSLDIAVDGMKVGVGPDDPDAGRFALSFPPGLGERIVASYQRA